MPSGASRAAMFFSAYAPLLGLFAVLRSFGSGWPTWACASAATVSLLWLAVFWRSVLAQRPGWVTTARVQSRDADVMAYFVTYVVPFAAAQDSAGRTRLALVVFLAIVGALYVRAGLLAINPVLLLVGYHVFEVETDEGRLVSLLTRRRFVPQHGTVSYVQISPYVLVEKRREPGDRASES